MELKDQRALYDQLSVITAQLESKGENLDSPWLLSKILSKFKETIQRRVLREKVSLPPTETWTRYKLMTTLDNVIKQEEEIEAQMPKKTSFRPAQPRESKGEYTAKKRPPFCFYCDSKEHWSVACTKITSPKARLEHLKKSNRCIGCGSKNHMFAECNGRGCINCGKKHHTSTCFKSANAAPSNPTMNSARSLQNQRAEEKRKSAQVRHNLVVCDERRPSVTEESDGIPNLSVMTVEETSRERRNEEIFLLTGTVRVQHPRTQQLMELNVLLDTGADRSFIEAQLAKDLELPNNGTTTMKLRTFGAQQPKQIQCINTCIEVWDAYGQGHKLHVYTHENLTTQFPRSKLDEQDIQFIRRKRIKLSTSMKGTSYSPAILIGCDQLWSLINFEAPHFDLPSGLVLVPTRLGYMVSGKKLVERDKSEDELHSSVHDVKLRVNLRRATEVNIQQYVLGLHPNVPVQVGSMEVTLSVLATPPLPVLEQIFITSNNRTALWDQKRLPSLRCLSYEHAEQLQCSLEHECECLPAESQVRCKCKDDAIMNTYQSIDNVLPATREQVRFLVHPRHGVMTKINQDVSAEIIVNVKEAIDDSITEVTDDICTIENTHLVGCYQCSKGATTAVKCTSTFNAVTAEIECGEDSFTVPCSPSGQISQLAFLMENARVQMQCTVKCGSRVNFFEVTGILKYVHKLHGNPMVYVQQKHNKTSEFRWPDVNHIVDIYLQW
ncbi:unnamed protein product [Nippostrongylus brasiliensis]|uniref:Peptidase A2 domain-containing protein n=1 Tax=Nippostrongylus brasiliensis TaxID=27835 RepID=A0A0N4XFC8_NIPBR|nr:unnamed protein product [Nippostrongylus brasiliensis]